MERRRFCLKSLIGGLCLLPISLCLASPTPPRAVGQLLNTTGNVQIQRGSQPARKGELLFPLYQGDLLRVGAGGSAEVVLFQNGARFRLSGASTARVGPSELKATSGAAPQALARLSSVFAKRLSAPARTISPRFLGVLVRDPGDPTVGPRNPLPNGCVPGEPVPLSWDGPIEGDGQRLEISDGKHVVYGSWLPPNARGYRLPAGILRPGEYYVWSITALSESVSEGLKGVEIGRGVAGARCRGLLRLLPTDEQAELDRLVQENTAARRSPSDIPTSQLLMAQIYERFGMFDEARFNYEEVLKLRPDDPGVKAALKHVGEAAATEGQR
jgi:hypothetical protein